MRARARPVRRRPRQRDAPAGTPLDAVGRLAGERDVRAYVNIQVAYLIVNVRRLRRNCSLPRTHALQHCPLGSLRGEKSHVELRQHTQGRFIRRKLRITCVQLRRALWPISPCIHELHFGLRDCGSGAQVCKFTLRCVRPLCNQLLEIGALRLKL